MPDAPAPTLAQLARRMCLQNALQHAGKCEPKGLVGRIMVGHAEFRSDPKGVAQALMEAGAAVNAMTVEQQQAALEAEAPEMLTVQKKEKRTGLKELPNVRMEGGRPHVVMRFAPNPNGPLSLGHSRGVSILAEYQRMYGATMILRFDDTDPQVKPPLMDDKRGWNGYEMIQSDYEWLVGRKPDRVLRASDRIGIYQDAARDLIRVGGAYVCNCDAETFKRLKDAKTPCPHRDQTVQHNLAGFNAMCDGSTVKGAAVLRIKTDITHPHPGLRDWTAFRVVARDAIHPRERKGEIPKHHAWPLLDFQSAIEDHLQGVTHVIRGKDLMDSTRKQTFLYKHMGWTYPETLYWGRVSVHEFGKFSTSMMRRAIEAGKFTGWDDPRLPCLAALRRRGYSPDAIRAFWVGMNLTEKDTAVSLENLDAEDGKANDPLAPRYFFVPDPIEVALEGAPDKDAHPLVHPSHPERGHRTLRAGHAIAIARGDFTPHLRLKDLGNVRLTGRTAAWESEAMERGIPIIQWLPAGHAQPFTVVKPAFVADEEPVAVGDDGPEDEPAAAGKPAEIEVPPLLRIEGLVEPAALKQVGRVVQFERFGFVRIESATQGVWLHQ
ncbi:MAG TPA: glutamate--tRNA ligase [Candidatus Thermoplasmatota archaeon]|nr:glutamate--tRNA ligase [Candidatus Thermoplasmatota archaeon]